MIGIIDTETGNIRSIANILQYLNIKFLVSKKYTDLENCEKIIFPGVGRYDVCMQNLRKNNLDTAIKDFVIKKKKKILGICVGMQLMLNYSEEGNSEGLQLIDGHCIKFPQDKVGNVPHIGWAPVLIKNDFFNFQNDINSRFYFCHSYYPEIKEKKIELIKSNYNFEFCAGFIKNNIIGVQFHPEKSLENGISFLKNFIEKF